MDKVTLIYNNRLKIVKQKREKQSKCFKGLNKQPKHFGFTIRVKFRE